MTRPVAVLAALAVISAVLGASLELIPRTRTTAVIDAPLQTLAGFSDLEPQRDGVVVRWVEQPEAAIVLPPAGRPVSSLALVLLDRHRRPGRQVDLLLNQRPAGRLTLPTDGRAIALPPHALPAEARISLRLIPNRADVTLIGLSSVSVTTGGLAALSPEVLAFAIGQAGVFLALFLLLWTLATQVPAAAAMRLVAAAGVLCGLLMAVVLVQYRFELYRVVAAWGPRSAILALVVLLLVHPSTQAAVERRRQAPRWRAFEEWFATPRAQAWRRRASTIAAVVLSAAGALYLIGLIRTYYVDVPMMDAWEMVPLVEKAYLGTATLHDFWMQANEHRPLFPRLILTVLARATSWDTRWEVALNLVTMTAMLVTVALYLRRASTGTPPFWVLPLAALFVFGPNQWENWLWGWQFLVFLQVSAGVAGLYLLSKPAGRSRDLAAGLALGFVGTYSFGNGLMFWAVAPIVLLMTRRTGRTAALAAWLAVAVVTVGSYAYGWRPNPGHPSVERNFESSGAFWYMVDFFQIYLGTPPASFDMDAARITGRIGLFLFACLTFVLVRSPRLRPILAFPFGLCLYALLGAALTSLGRAGLGLPVAMSSRYITLCGPFWVGLLLFLFVEATDAASRLRPVSAPLARVAAAALAALSLYSWSQSEPDWRWWQMRIAPARQALKKGEGVEQTRLYPHHGLLGERRAILERRRLSVFRPSDADDRPR